MSKVLTNHRKDEKRLIMENLNKENILMEFNDTYQAGIGKNHSPYSDLEILAKTLNISEEIEIPGSHKAVIGWEEQDFSHGYVESFYKNATLGIQKMETGFEDYYIYSIMYNYRHFIELSLIELILSFRLSFGMNLYNNNKNSHNLSDLAIQLKDIVNGLELDELFPEIIHTQEVWRDVPRFTRVPEMNRLIEKLNDDSFISSEEMSQKEKNDYLLDIIFEVLDLYQDNIDAIHYDLNPDMTRK